MNAPHTAPASSDLVISRLLRAPLTCMIGDPLHAPMVGALNALFDRHAQRSSVTITFRTRIFSGGPR